MTNEFDFTMLESYDKTQFEIEGKKLIRFIGNRTRVKIPDGVTEVMAKAFEGKDITELHIPSSVKNVDLSSFKGCDRLKKVEIPLHLAKDIENLTKLFGENVAKIDFEFEVGYPIDFNTLLKIQQGLDKIHIDDDEKESVDLDIDFDKEDPLLKDVIECIIDTQTASASMIQRHFAIGYARVAKIIDFLEEKGLIGPQQDATPRKIYINADMYGNKEEETKPATSDIGFDTQPELLKEALKIFIRSGEVSCAALQRKLALGYNKAARIVKFFEEQKFISRDHGDGKREVLITKADFEKLFHETVD